jgi:hypothetical protein
MICPIRTILLRIQDSFLAVHGRVYPGDFDLGRWLDAAEAVGLSRYPAAFGTGSCGSLPLPYLFYIFPSRAHAARYCYFRSASLGAQDAKHYGDCAVHSVITDCDRRKSILCLYLCSCVGSGMLLQD